MTIQSFNVVMLALFVALGWYLVATELRYIPIVRYDLPIDDSVYRWSLLTQVRGKLFE